MAPVLLSMEKLITEVQKQPCIWNIHHGSYNDKQLKLKTWQKICREFYPDTVKNSTDETSKIAFIQKKWKSVRDYYIKQRKEVDSPENSKRKKYIYFDMLRFLETNSGPKPYGDKFDCSRASSLKGTNEELIQEESLDQSQEAKEDFIKQEEFEDHDFSAHEPDQVCHSTFITKKTEIDEDEMFLMSLLPSIRKLDPLQKLNLKLEVMKALRNVQFPLKSNY